MADAGLRYAGLLDWQPQDRIIERQDEPDRFDFAEAGQGCEALTFPIFEDFDDTGASLVDMVAWKAEKPNQWWLWTGDGLIAGLWLFTMARVYQKVLCLVATPAQWVRAPKTSACLLNPKKTDLGETLRDIDVQCEDEEHAAWLKAEINRQGKLKIRIR